MRRQRRIRRVSITLFFLSCLGLSGIGASMLPPGQISGVRVAEAAASKTDGANNSAQWRFAKAIEPGDGAIYQKLYLDEEVYKHANSSLSDLRIEDNQGQFVPFYRESREAEWKEQSNSYKTDLTLKFNKNLETTFDYRVIPNEENRDIQGSRLEFDLPGEAFLKHVQIYGGYDGNTWEPLAKGDLYRVGEFAQNGIDLGSAYKFTHYRLVVPNNAEKLEFGQMKLIHKTAMVTVQDFIRQRDPVYEMKQEGSKTQLVIRNDDRLQVSMVRLEATGNFTRTYVLRDDSERELGVVGSSKLYRLDFKDSRIAGTDIILQEPTTAPYFAVVIENRDDAPISLQGVHLEYLVDKLVFPAEGEGPFRLVYGNIGALAPQYDIVSFKSHIEGEKIGTARLGPENALPEVSTVSSTGLRWLTGATGFNTVIIIVSLLLIILLVRKLNRK
ncbi:DUF3999 family protein [Paenibacillus sp. GCM10012306]|uniref:DUF3999 family protein n=1 Tax=Paenibacillus sp. GCM10012306 TaxID=3317342 RepID=UPI00360FEFED